MLLSTFSIGLNGQRGAGASLSISVSIGAGPFESGATLTATVNNLVGGETVTYQWQDDGVDIAGATASTYVATIGTDSIADASDIRCVVTVDATPYNSGTREIRYALGTAPAVADGQAWTVTDTAINIDASASGANLTFSYAASGLPAGVTINSGTGAITGTVSAEASGTATVTATDQYSRTYEDTFTWTAALRAQATAANGLGPFAWTVDDTTVNENLASDFTVNGNTLSYVVTGLPTGVVDDTDGTISGTPSAVSSGTITVTATDEYLRETVSTISYTSSLRAIATAAGGLGPFNFPENVAITNQDLSADFTLNGNTLTYTITGGALPTGLSLASNGILSGTPTTITASDTYTVRGQDEYGRNVDSSFTLEIVASNPAINPSITDDTFTAGSAGNPASFTINGSYAGADTLTLYAATGTDPITVSQAQLVAGSGGTNTLEFFSISSFTFGSSEDITGLTATSETANRLAYVIVEDTNGGTSGVQTPTDVVSDLDFTADGFSSAEVGNIDADTLRITFAGAQYGTAPATGDFSLTGNTISAVSFTAGNAFVDLTLGTTVLSTDDYTGDLSYTGTSLTDDQGNTTPTFASQNVTNNVSGAAIAPVISGAAIVTKGNSQNPNVTIPTTGSNGDLLLLIVTNDYFTGTTPHFSLTESGWTEHVNFASGNNDVGMAIYSRVVDGTEGSTVQVNFTSFSFNYVATSYLIPQVNSGTFSVSALISPTGDGASRSSQAVAATSTGFTNPSLGILTYALDDGDRTDVTVNDAAWTEIAEEIQPDPSANCTHWVASEDDIAASGSTTAVTVTFGSSGTQAYALLAIECA